MAEKNYPDLIARTPTKLNIVDPDARFDRDADRDQLVRMLDGMSDLEQYVQALKEDSDNPETRKDLGGLVYGNEGFYREMPADVIRDDAKQKHSGLVDLLGGWVEPVQKDGKTDLEIRRGYVENNFAEFLNALTDEELEQVLTSLPLYTTKDNDINRVIEAVREMQKLSQIKDEKGVRDYVMQKMQASAEITQRFFSNYVLGSSIYVQKLFQSYAGVASARLGKEIKNNGSFNRARVRKTIEESLEVAEDEFNREKHLGDKSDIFEGAIRPYYITTAKASHQRMRKDMKWDQDEDRQKRKAYRRKELKMAA